jgi:HEAT repeat protein
MSTVVLRVHQQGGRFRIGVLGLSLTISVAALAQQPVFTPPEPPRPAPSNPAEPVRPETVPQPTAKDPISELLAKLSSWPNAEGRDASLILAGLGPEVVPRLEGALRHNDWRVQAGAAAALAERGEKPALDAVLLAVKDPSNRAGLPFLMKSAVALDPARASLAILPFLAHESGRTREAAKDALPTALPADCVPTLLEHWRNPRPGVRVTALAMLLRTPEGGERKEWFDALADPEPPVAILAARTLAETRTPARIERLRSLAVAPSMRMSAYALLSLVYAEDLAGTAYLQKSPEIRARIDEFVRSDDEFYRATGAIAVSNLSFRSDDGELRRVADRFVVPILLATLAGGSFFTDYGSIEDLAWKKLEMLTGRGFGQNARAWKTWWDENGASFVARRELGTVVAQDLQAARVVAVSSDGAKLRTYYFAGLDDEAAGAAGSAPLVLGAPERAELVGALSDLEFFDRTSGVAAAGESWLKLSITIPGGAQHAEKVFAGAAFEEARPLLNLLDRLERDLAWQRFLPGTSPGARATALREALPFYSENKDAEARAARTADLVLTSYEQSPASARRLGVLALEAAPAAWKSAKATETAALLRHENSLSEAARELLRWRSDSEDGAFRAKALELLDLATAPDAESVLTTFLSGLPQSSVVGLVRDGRTRIRAAAVGALSRFRGDDQVANLAVEALKDPEPKVREAAVAALTALQDERLLALLETIIKGDDASLRPHAVRALAVVGGDQAIPRLHEIYRAGDREQRWAVVRGLRLVPTRRGLVAQSVLVKEPGALDVRREALGAIASVPGDDSSQILADLLSSVPEVELKSEAAMALADRTHPGVAPALLKASESEDPGLRRLAWLGLGRQGQKEAHVPLLEILAKSLEGDLAAERALEDLTFQSPRDPSPPRRFDAHRTFRTRFGEQPRSAWFLLAASQSGTPLDEGVDWLGAGPLKERECRLLLRLVERGSRPLQALADRRLRGLLAPELEPLSAAASRAEIDARLAAFNLKLAEPPSGR